MLRDYLKTPAFHNTPARQEFFLGASIMLIDQKIVQFNKSFNYRGIQLLTEGRWISFRQHE